MTASRFHKYRQLYGELLYVCLPSTTTLGFTIGFFSNLKNRESKPLDDFANIIGYTSLGFMTGITYPISYPLLGFYVLHKNIK